MATRAIPRWAKSGFIAEFFELHKLGYMKRFVMCLDKEDAVMLGQIAFNAGCSIRRVISPINPLDMHYFLPDDIAQATFEIIAYYTGEHADGEHMLGRLAP
jgi:hypothetical protein